MLPFLLLLQHVRADDHSVISHTIRNITSCPDVGYFFQIDKAPNAIESGVCHLCFCKDNDTAMCWLRDIRRCNEKKYHHFGKREARSRRSLGFGDIFFRDATRDVLQKRLPEQCKPYESSFSEGCPPADWCIGCTVCDCDANGRWDCHILSFCPDKNKKPTKKPKGKKSIKYNNLKSNKTVYLKKSKPQKNVKQPQKRSYKSIPKKQTPKTINIKKASNKKKDTKKISKLKKNNNRWRNKPAPKKKFSKKVVKKDVKDQNKKYYKSALKNVPYKNDTYKLAEVIVKKVMVKVEKMVNENQKIQMNKMNALTKTIQKRSMQTQNRYKNNKSQKSFNAKQWKMKYPPRKKIKSNRYKRSINETLFKNRVVMAAKVPDTVSNTTRRTTINETVINLINSAKVSQRPLEFYKYIVNEYPSNDTISKQAFDDIHNIMSYNNTTTNASKYLKQYDATTNNSITLLNSSLESNVVQNEIENVTCGKVCRLKQLLKSIFHKLNKNETNFISKVNKFQFFTKVKKLFKNVTSNYNKRKPKMIRLRKEKSIKRTLCKNFGLCQYNFNNKLLKSKIQDLKLESNIILKSIECLHSLLSYYKRNTNYLHGNHTSNRSDVDIFREIFRDHYFNGNLTIKSDADRIQIEYIKNNIESFVRSLEKFAFILDDIIDITEKQHSKRNKSKKRIKCIAHKVNENKNDFLNTKMDQIKKMLLNYNYLQNKFMNKIYAVLSSLQQNVNETKIIQSNEYKIKMLQNYSKVLTGNIKRLNGLGHISNMNLRRKREAMGDNDAIDYLLMLMEYLMKQNKPINVAPVNDGIDLLIEAIKSAPDIKPIDLRIHHHSTRRPTATRTTEISVTHKHKFNKITKAYTAKVLNFKMVDFVDKNENIKITDDLYVEKYLNENKTHTEINESGETTEASIPVYVHKIEEDAMKSDNLEKKNLNHKFEIFEDGDDEDDNLVQTAKRKLDKTKSDHENGNSGNEKVEEKIWNHDDNESENKHKSNKMIWSKDDLESDLIDIVSSIPSTTESYTQRTVKMSATRTARRYGDKYKHPVSSMSAEDSREFKTLRKVDKDDDRNKDIFESIDYNTEKSDIESESKEERSNDNFLSDFA